MIRAQFKRKVSQLKYLVTGAAGFIGSNLSAKLADAKNSVLGLDNFSSYYSPQLKRMRCIELLQPRNIEVVEIDLANLDKVQGIVLDFQPDVIIHLAAQPGVRTPLSNSFQYIENNLSAFGNILQSAVQNKVPGFLYASSSSVYGNSTEAPFKESNTSIRPISIYGATKLANEILVPPFVSRSATRARGMRFFTVYGPWGRPDMAYFRIINSLLDGSRFNKFGDGNVRRDFTYIDDITSGIEKLSLELASHAEGYSDVVNIGGGNPHSLNDLIEVISSKLGKNLKTSVINSHPNDTSLTCADVSTLVNLIGISPKVTLEEGINKTIEWAQKVEIQSRLKDWISSTN